MKLAIYLCLMLLAAMVLTACGYSVQAAPVAISANQLSMVNTGKIDYFDAAGAPIGQDIPYGETLYIDPTVYVNGVRADFPVSIATLLPLLEAESALLTVRGTEQVQPLTLEELDGIMVKPDTCGELQVQTATGRTVEIHWYAPYAESRRLLDCKAATTIEQYDPEYGQPQLRVLSGQVHVGLHQDKLLEIVGAENVPQEEYSQIVFLCREENPRKQNDQITLNFDDDGILQNIVISTFQQTGRM